MLDQDRSQMRPGFQSDRVGGRRLLIALCLLSVAGMLCIGCILLLLQHVEAKNASFKPPMTALERERLLPPEPRLETTPSLGGLRYGEQARQGVSDDPSEMSLEQVRSATNPREWPPSALRISETSSR